MKKLVLFIVLLTLVLVGPVINSNAADQLLDTKIDSASVQIDKNGNEYVRFIITETRTLNGISYDRSLPVMAFGATVSDAKAYKAGDQLKAIVSYRKLTDGRESYNVLGFAK